VELTSSVHGQVEIVWQGTSVPAGLKVAGAEYHVAGDTMRVVVPEESQEGVLEVLRRERLRLISVTPVRVSLEDYFVTQLTPAAQEAVTS